MDFSRRNGYAHACTNGGHGKEGTQDGNATCTTFQKQVMIIKHFFRL
jgi:hypothetical protein